MEKCALLGDIYITTEKPMSYQLMEFLSHVVCYDFNGIPTTFVDQAIVLVLISPLSGRPFASGNNQHVFINPVDINNIPCSISCCRTSSETLEDGFYIFRYSHLVMGYKFPDGPV